MGATMTHTMTPADLRAIAARVMAGEDVPAHKITHAMGQTTVSQCLHSLDAADLLMAPLRERGWIFQAALLPNWCWIGAERWIEGGGFLRDRVKAPTEPRARTALALLCMAAEMETTP